MDKNLPAKVENTGSVPGLRRFHMPWRNEANGLRLLSPRSRIHAPQREAPPSEKPTHLNKEEPPLTATREKPASNEEPVQLKINQSIHFEKRL